MLYFSSCVLSCRCTVCICCICLSNSGFGICLVWRGCEGGVHWKPLGHSVTSVESLAQDPHQCFRVRPCLVRQRDAGCQCHMATWQLSSSSIVDQSSLVSTRQTGRLDYTYNQGLREKARVEGVVTKGEAGQAGTAAAVPVVPSTSRGGGTPGPAIRQF